MQSSAEISATQELTYAQQGPSYAHKVWAGAAITFAGLALVVIGGCFLIGVMLVNRQGFNPAATPLSMGPADYIFIGILYSLATLSFISAAFVIRAGLSALFRVMHA